MKCLFFSKIAADSQPAQNAGLKDYEWQLWRPKLTKIKPSGVTWLPFSVWWIFHVLKIFRNEKYAVFLVYKNGRMVHRSCVFPGYFRFPFMKAGDVQVGDTWTAEEERNKGLATLALGCIGREFKGSTIWYLTEDLNIASIRVVEKCGFRLTAEGRRTKMLGLSILGKYAITKELGDSQQPPRHGGIVSQ